MSMKSQENWIEKLIGHNGRERVRKAVESVEKRTSAEIVPVIVHSSTPFGHVPWLVFFILLIFLWGILPILFPHLSLYFVEAVSFAVAIVGSYFLEKIDSVRRALTPLKDQVISVDRRAIIEFHHAQVAKTSKGIGVLLFISALEHRAVVLVDQAIAAQFPQENWNAAIKALVDKAKAGHFADGMCDSLELLCNQLVTKFPPDLDKKNQLDDRLIIKA